MPSFSQLKKDKNITLTPAKDASIGKLTFRDASLGIYDDLEDDNYASTLRYVGGDSRSVMEILWYLWETYGTLWFADSAHDPYELDDVYALYGGSPALSSAIAAFYTGCMLEMMDEDDPRRDALEKENASAEKKRKDLSPS